MKNEPTHNVSDELYEHAKTILEDKREGLSYGLFMLTIMKLSGEEESVINSAIKKITKQISNDKRYQNLFFHGIKSGLDAVNMQRYKQTILQMLPHLLINYAHLNLVTYRQAIIALQQSLKDSENKETFFLPSNNFFLRQNPQKRLKHGAYIYHESMLQDVNIASDFNDFWQAVYKTMLRAHQYEKDVRNYLLFIGLLVFVYFTQFRSADSVNNDKSELSNNTPISWEMLIYTLLGTAVSVLVLAAALRAMLPKKGAADVQSIKAIHDEFLSLYSTIFTIDLLSLSTILPDFVSNGLRNNDDKASIVVVMNIQENKEELNREKILDYCLELESPINPYTDIYKPNKPKKQKKSTNKQEMMSSSSLSSSIVAHQSMEALEWNIEGLSIKFLWDPNTKQTWCIDEPQKSYDIRYITNPSNIRYFLFIPLQTIAAQGANDITLKSVQYVKEQPFNYRVRMFTDGLERSASITLNNTAVNAGQANTSSHYILKVKFEVILNTEDRVLGGIHTSSNSNAILAFAPVFFKGGAHTKHALQKTLFGTITLADEDIAALKLRPSI